jgi:hypothetical protein
VDDATHSVMPPDPEMIQVGDIIWQGPQWRRLVQRTVRPVRIVEVLVLPQHHHQVALIPEPATTTPLTTGSFPCGGGGNGVVGGTCVMISGAGHAGDEQRDRDGSAGETASVMNAAA